MHPYVCSSTISNSQDMEAAYMPTGKRMDKEDVCMCVCVCVCVCMCMYIYINGMLLSQKQRTKQCHLQQHGWTRDYHTN